MPASRPLHPVVDLELQACIHFCFQSVRNSNSGRLWHGGGGPTAGPCAGPLYPAAAAWRADVRPAAYGQAG